MSHMGDRGVAPSDTDRKNRFAVGMLMLDSQSSWQICNPTDHTEESIMHYSLLMPWLSVLLWGGLERDKSHSRAPKWNWLCFLWSWKFWALDTEVWRAEYLCLLPAVITVSERSGTVQIGSLRAADTSVESTLKLNLNYFAHLSQLRLVPVEINKSVLAKALLMISSRDVSQSWALVIGRPTLQTEAALTVWVCKELKGESEIKVVKLQKLKSFVMTCERTGLFACWSDGLETLWTVLRP